MSTKKRILFTTLFIIVALLTIWSFRPNEPDVKIVRTSILPMVEPEKAKSYLNGKPVDLVFFFQGVANDIILPFSYSGLNLASEKKIYRDDLVFISFDFNTPLHWSSPKTVISTINAIKYLIGSFNTRKVKIIGVSMGGALALDIISKADSDLKSKISDVLVVYPVVDYKYTFFNTKRKNIRKMLLKHFFSYKHPFNLMKESSPFTFYKSISKDINITIIEGIYDTHVCSDQIEKYFEKIKLINKNVKLLRWDIDHSLIDMGDRYEKVVLSILN